MISLPVFAKAFNGCHRRKSVLTSVDAWTGSTMMAGGLYLYLSAEFSTEDKTGRIFVTCEKFTYSTSFLWFDYQDYNRSSLVRFVGQIFNGSYAEPPRWDDPVFLRTDSHYLSHVITPNPNLSPKIVLEVDVKDDEVDEIMMLMALEYAQ